MVRKVRAEGGLALAATSKSAHPRESGDPGVIVRGQDGQAAAGPDKSTKKARAPAFAGTSGEKEEAQAKPVLAWSPQPGPQTAFVNCPVFDVCYGGARGGGKTDACLGEFVLHQARHGSGAKGLFVRRKQVDLASTLERARQVFGAAGAKWQEQKSCFRFPSGAVIWFRHLERDSDAEHFQGHDYTRVYVEELTQFPTPGPVDKLKAALRSASGVPCGLRASCNPGGPGHGWVKARYIDQGPWRIVRQRYVSPFDGSETELDRVFIPARLSDNALLIRQDPLYVAKLQQSGSAELVRAWLEGDWNIVEGAFFDGWSGRNVVRPFAVPPEWTRLRSLDWGSARPFSVGWWAIASDPAPAEGEGGQPVVIPRGALVRYREWYGCSGKPNEGLKLPAEQVAEGITSRETGEKVAYGVADPAIFASDGGPSIAERMFRQGVVFKRADNARVARGGAMGGWDQMRARIRGDEAGPQLVVFSTCRDFLRTVPVLQHDSARPEDLDTEAEDHIADETRYACMSRPYVRRVAAEVARAEPPRGLAALTWDEAMRMSEQWGEEGW